MRLGEQPQAFVETFSTGALTLDLALGGGLPRGRIVEVYGPESSGKTTLARLLLGVIQPTAGSILYRGVGLNSMDPSARKNFRREVQAMFLVGLVVALLGEGLGKGLLRRLNPWGRLVTPRKKKGQLLSRVSFPALLS